MNKEGYLLPELPKVRNKDEADFSLEFRNWIMENPHSSCSFEMKDSRGEFSIPFSEITEEQLNYGMQIKYKKEGVLIRQRDIDGIPDYLYFRKASAFVVIAFPNFFEMIDVETLEMEMKRSKRKSLTSFRAKELSVLSVKR